MTWDLLSCIRYAEESADPPAALTPTLPFHRESAFRGSHKKAVRDTGLHRIRLRFKIAMRDLEIRGAGNLLEPSSTVISQASATTCI